MAAACRADETTVLATPAVPAGDAVTGWHIEQLNIFTGVKNDPVSITVVLAALRADGWCARNPGGICQMKTVIYSGADAIAMLNNLNTANLSSNSLRRRILTKLLTDGHIQGSLSGTAGVPTPTP
jgi:hypothetical protein